MSMTVSYSISIRCRDAQNMKGKLKMTTKHTPTPYYHDAENHQILSDVNSGRQLVCLVYAPTVAEQLKTAAFIVKACNAHDKLVEALENVQRLVAQCAPDGFTDGRLLLELYASNRKTSQALAAAKGDA